jgi:hypothetical protein
MSFEVGVLLFYILPMLGGIYFSFIEIYNEEDISSLGQWCHMVFKENWDSTGPLFIPGLGLFIFCVLVAFTTVNSIRMASMWSGLTKILSKISIRNKPGV